jgi:serine/threonine protein kinase
MTRSPVVQERIMLDERTLSQMVKTWNVGWDQPPFRDLLQRCCDLAHSSTPRLVLDGYTFDQHAGFVGRGAYGAVFLVHDSAGERKALKFFDVDAEHDGPGVQMLAREVAAGLRCASEHVARYERLVIRPVCRAPGEISSAAICYAVREYVDGACPTFESISGLDESTRHAVFLSLARGLWDLDRASLVHRDVRPENAVFLGRRAKWLDLGQVRIAGRQEPGPPRIARPLQRPSTVPPEAWANNELDYDRWGKRGDVFAFGATLFNLVTDDWPPLRPSEVAERLKKIDVPFSLRTQIESMLQTNPGDRPGMEVVVQDMEKHAP